MSATQFFFYPQNILYFVIAFTNLFIGIYLFGKHKFGKKFYFLLIYTSIFIWSFGIGMRSSIVGFEEKMFWTQFAYIGIVTTPIFFLFAMRSTYIKTKFLSSQWIGFLLVAFAILVLIYTDSYHHLFWLENTDSPNEWNYLHYSGGVMYWVNTIYQFVIGGMVFAILLKARKNPLHQACSQIFLLSIIPPVITNILFSAGITFLPDYNIAPLGFLLTGPIMAIGFRNIKLFDLAGVGIDQYLNDMGDGIVIAGSDGRVQMVNPFAQKMLDVSEGSFVSDSKLLSTALFTDDLKLERRTGAYQFQTDFPDEFFYIELKSFPILNIKGVSIGELITLNNISTEKKIANVVKVSQIQKIKSQERERLAKELQDRIVQDLHTIKINLITARKHVVDAVIVRTFEDIVEITTLVDQLVKKVNLLYYELDDDSFGKIGLVQALHDQIEIQKFQNNIDINLVNFDTAELTMVSQRTIYGIVVGVLNEILKLSKPASIAININDTPKNFMIKFIIHEKLSPSVLLTKERVDAKFMEICESIENINGVFEFSATNDGQILINIQLPRK